MRMDVVQMVSSQRLCYFQTLQTFSWLEGCVVRKSGERNVLSKTVLMAMQRTLCVIS